MVEKWGPWIDCDGAGGPQVANGQVLQVRVDISAGNGLILPQDGCDVRLWPGFTWRWIRVRTGWFRSALRRVCDDPAYAPIERYRLLMPPGAAIQLLTSIVENPRAPVAPATEREHRLPKKVSHDC